MTMVFKKLNSERLAAAAGGQVKIKSEH